MVERIQKREEGVRGKEKRNSIILKSKTKDSTNERNTRRERKRETRRIRRNTKK